MIQPAITDSSAVAVAATTTSSAVFLNAVTAP